MEQKEAIGLKQLQEIQSTSSQNGKLTEEISPVDAIIVVINSENYRIEIEIY